jgi:outer membrane protein OmpA-like peptidoglycan-associated protein
MADLNVQPKKKTNWLPWLLLILGLIAIIFFLSRGCNNNKGNQGSADSTSASSNTGGAANATAASSGGNWNDVDFNAPNASYDEITDKNISVRGNNNYGIYSLGENILFDEGKNTIRPDAEQNLRQVAGSINKRFNGASIRVFGYTDSIGSKGYNKELAEQRAEAVRSWLVKNGNISENNISVQPVGEARPIASNATSQGRQQNRRVEIVARNNNQNGQ